MTAKWIFPIGIRYFTRPATGFENFLANPGQLLTRKHIDDPRATNTGPHQNNPGMVARNMANDRSRLTERMGLHCRKNPISFGGTRKNQQFAFIGNVKRIQTENFARTLYLFTDWDRGFVPLDSNAGRLGNFVQRTGESAPRR